MKREELLAPPSYNLVSEIEKYTGDKSLPPIPYFAISMTANQVSVPGQEAEIQFDR